MIPNFPQYPVIYPSRNALDHSTEASDHWKLILPQVDFWTTGRDPVDESLENNRAFDSSRIGQWLNFLGPLMSQLILERLVFEPACGH